MMTSYSFKVYPNKLSIKDNFGMKFFFNQELQTTNQILLCIAKPQLMSNRGLRKFLSSVKSELA